MLYIVPVDRPYWLPGCAKEMSWRVIMTYRFIKIRAKFLVKLRKGYPAIKMAFEPFVEGWDFVETLGEGAYGE